MAKTCVGCGATLQTTEKDEPGYVPQSALEREQPICRRCFRIRNYGEFSRVMLPVDRYAKEVSLVMGRPGLVLYVLDVFDLAGSLVPALREYIGQSPVLAVVNKVDLLPKEVNVRGLRRWILESLAKDGIQAVDVSFVSADTGEGLEELQNVIARRHENRVYAVGMANVGKSSLLNRLVSAAADSPPFTASRVPGTTLGVAQFELALSTGRRVSLLDTPGLIMQKRATDVLCEDCLKTVVPRARLRPKVYQLLPGQTLFFGGFARLDFDNGERQSVVCYVSNELVVHRTKTERADSFADLHADDILGTPCSSCRRALGQWSHAEVNVQPHSRGVSISQRDADERSEVIKAGIDGCDLVLAGVGFISLTGTPFSGRIWHPEGIALDARPRLIGGPNKPFAGNPKVGINRASRKYT